MKYREHVLQVDQCLSESSNLELTGSKKRETEFIFCY